MIRATCCWLALVAACASACAFAQDAGTLSKSKIPYKTEATPLEEHGPRVGWALLAFLVASGGAMYVLRKKIPSLAGTTDNDNYLRILKRTRLNPRTTLYVIEFNQRKLLIGQVGDQLVRLAEAGDQPHSLESGNV